MPFPHKRMACKVTPEMLAAMPAALDEVASLAEALSKDERARIILARHPTLAPLRTSPQALELFCTPQYARDARDAILNMFDLVVQVHEGELTVEGATARFTSTTTDEFLPENVRQAARSFSEPPGHHHQGARERSHRLDSDEGEVGTNPRQE
jgi:hypothetical protein